MVTRLLGRKIGMTRIFDAKGRAWPVTVVEAGPCTVLQVKTKDRDGYAAIQIGFGERRRRNTAHAMIGHQVPRPADQKKEDRGKQVQNESKHLKPAAFIREIPWDGKEEVTVGQKLTISIFENQKKCDVVGTSKGRGFMGVVRRHGFHGLPATHGQSDRERAPGALGRQHSISQGVYPGKKMAGHWGHERVTSRNLDIVKIHAEKNLLYVAGAVPGPNGGFIQITESHWTPPKPSTVVSKKTKAPAKK